MPEEAQLKCLRCGHDFTGHYTPGVVEERICPKCKSFSVRRIKEKKQAAGDKEGAKG